MSIEDDLLDPGVEVTLANCDREPIHIPGAIQPHGLLLTLSEPDGRVRQVSANVEAVLGRRVERVLGESIDGLLGEPAATAIRELAGHDVDAHPAVGSVEVEVEGEAEGGDRTTACEVFVHRSGGLLVCELEPRAAGDPVASETVTAADVPGISADARQLFARAASEVRQLTGYDRVMVYRFDEDGHGEVVGEARDARLDPLLGHHYPASDIPRQARALYLRQTIRLIVDVDYEPAAIVPEDDPLTGEPLDLGLATLRSVSPIHLQYLRNMGVTGTLTISLVRDGELWGMLACHHYSRHLVPYRIRSACRYIGELLSAQLANIEAIDLAREREALAAARGRLHAAIREAPDVRAGLRATAESLAELLVADGVAVVATDERITAGYVPEPGVEAEILGHLTARQPLVIDRLSREMPTVSHETELSGVLALPLPHNAGTHIVWYRDEWARELKWGGDPNASLRPDLTSTDPSTLSPRRSFETWRQTVVGQSRPWTEAQIEAAIEFVESLAP